MRVRTIHTKVLGWASELNTSSTSEVIIHFDDGDATSEYVQLLEVFLENPLESSVYRPNVWISMHEAFRSRDLITDNYNTHFREPITEEEKARGWYE